MTPRIYATLERENRRLRARLKDTEQITLTAGEVSINRLERTVAIAGEPVAVTWSAFLLLEYLLLHKGEVIDRETLCALLWPEKQPTSDMLPVVAHQLRSQLGAAGDIVQVVRGKGYTIT